MGIDDQLRGFFSKVDENASPLNDELFRAIEARAKEVSELRKSDQEKQKKFLDIQSVKQWSGLLQESHNSAQEKRKKVFIAEWYETLQILRTIGSIISRDDNRPKWLPENVPAGAQADQFLHAHYYNHVIGADQRSYYEAHFAENRLNPDQALQEQVEWWRDLAAPPTEEDVTLLEWAPFLQSALSKDRILNLSANDFSGVCERIWSIQDHARRVANSVLGLPGGRRYDRPTKTEALAKFLFEQRAYNGASILQVIHYVLYEGPNDVLSSRLWEAVSNEKWRIPHFGISALGEIVGWALPETFPPRNNRTSKSLRSLGFPVSAHG